MIAYVSWFVLASAVFGVTPQAPNPAEISVTLRLLNGAGTTKSTFWFGEPIRFEVALASEAQPAMQLQLRGTRNPLFPLGDGLEFRRSDGKSYRFGLTPVWHHLPETKELHLSREATSFKLEFPDYSDVAQHQYKLLSTSPVDVIVPLKERSLMERSEWLKGLTLIPSGTYSVTFVRAARRTQRKKVEEVELRSNTVLLTIRE